jgi:hypothetical protein
MDADVLVIDEISMVSPAIFELLQEVCKGVREDEKDFGGLQLLFCGDYHQVSFFALRHITCTILVANTSRPILHSYHRSSKTRRGGMTNASSALRRECGSAVSCKR